MTEFDEDDRRIIDHLRANVERGERYFRSKSIAASLELSAKQVGARLPRLAEETDEIEIEKWGRSRSTTWRVDLG